MDIEGTLASPSGSRRWAKAAVVVSILALVVLSITYRRAPTVSLSATGVDTVRVSDMDVAVRATGTMGAAEVVLVASMTAGRVDEIVGQVGENVKVGDRLLRLTNPEVQLQALEATQRLVQARLSALSGSTLRNQEILERAAAVSHARGVLGEALRQQALVDSLGHSGLVSVFDVARTAEELRRARAELRRDSLTFDLLKATSAEEERLRVTEVRNLVAIVRSNSARERAMDVRAPAEGVLLGMTPHQGEWVLPGTELARVARPGRRHAVLRIAEGDADGLRLGATARIYAGSRELSGVVVRVDPRINNGSVAAEVDIRSSDRQGGFADASVEADVIVGVMKGVRHVRRVGLTVANQKCDVFVLSSDRLRAVRRTVSVGRVTSREMEILDGLAIGESILLSDLADLGSVEAVRVRP